MSPLQNALFRLVMRVFERGTATPSERRNLAMVGGKDGLSTSEIETVFRAFLRATWGDVIDDDALTAEDWERLAFVMAELRLPSELVPFPAELKIAV
jgi:hypothetical protein